MTETTRFDGSMDDHGLPPVQQTIELPDDPAATHALGRAMGRHLQPGQVLALVGELGAGKTTLTRGLAEGLDVEDPESVASPTYLLVIEHPGPRPLRHADAYLPAKLEGFLADGGLEYLFAADAVVVVEWADRIHPAIPDTALWLQLSMTVTGGRRAELRCSAPEGFPWLGSMGDNWRK